MDGPVNRDAGGGAARTLGGWLVRRYPSPWRGRYQYEVLALLDESLVRWRDVADLARGLLVERARSIFEPGDHPGLTLTAFLLIPLVPAYALSIAAAAFGHAAANWLGPVPRGAGILAQLVTMACLGAWFACTWSWEGQASKDRRSRWEIAAARHWMWVVLLLSANVLANWSSSVPPPGLLLSLLPGLILFWMWASRQPWSRIPVVMQQLFASKRDFKWALLELERCERLAAAGMSSPLEEARASIERISKSREEALAALHGMGYRSRFRQAAG